jgi:hypothetical protein
MKQVTGRFNAHMKNLLLLHANEAIWGGDKISEGALKGLITDPTTPIEFKGKDIINVRNYKRLIVSANEDWAVPMDADDRRFFVLDVSDKYKEDEKWFAPIIEQMNSGGLEALMHDLMRENLKDFNVRKPPVSPDGFDMKLMSMDLVFQWLYEHLADETSLQTIYSSYNSMEDWDLTPAKQEVHKDYTDWCKNNGKGHPDTQATLTVRLKKVITCLGEIKKDIGGGTRRMCYKLPPLKECRKLFEAFTKSDSSIWPHKITTKQPDKLKGASVDHIPF